jgi:hypothetical protein
MRLEAGVDVLPHIGAVLVPISLQLGSVQPGAMLSSRSQIVGQAPGEVQGVAPGVGEEYLLARHNGVPRWDAGASS